MMEPNLEQNRNNTSVPPRRTDRELAESIFKKRGTGEPLDAEEAALVERQREEDKEDRSNTYRSRKH